MTAIKRVVQKDEYGCLPACLAMIRGVAYDRVAPWFSVDLSKEGIEFQKGVDYLCQFGFQVIYKEIYSGNHPNFGFKEVTTPFAPMHIVSLQVNFDSKERHAVVMTRTGKILDPGPHNLVKSFKGIWEVPRCVGIWPK